jgi:hypothetical protein
MTQRQRQFGLFLVTELGNRETLLATAGDGTATGNGRVWVRVALSMCMHERIFRFVSQLVGHIRAVTCPYIP